MKMRNFIKNLYYDYWRIPKMRLKSYLHYGDSDVFDRVAIETTTHCNFRCPQCPNSKNERGLLKNKKMMPDKMFGKIINDLAERKYNGGVMFQFFGEPLTDERIFESVEYARLCLPDATLQINTNGSLLTKEKYDKLIKAGIDLISVTEYKTPIIDRLRKQLGDFKIFYRRLYDTGMSNIGGEVEVPSNTNAQRPDCTISIGFLTIDYAGNVVLCCNDYHSSVKWGNVEKENVFAIWNKPEFKKFRKKLFRRKYDLEICKRCVGLK